MGLTKNGMRIGMARHIELREQRQWINDVSDQNSVYWRARLHRAMETILEDERMEMIWDSELVPENTSYQKHALLAESIVRGELDEPYRILQNITLEAQDDYFKELLNERLM